MSNIKKFYLCLFLTVLMFFISFSCVKKVEPSFKSFYSEVVMIEVETIYGESIGGSGIFVQDNYILTACHVVEDAKRIKIIWADGREQETLCFETDPRVDLGLIYIDTEEIEGTKTFKDAEVGETIRIVGGPLGIFPYVTEGIVSAVDVNDSFFSEHYLDYVDAASNPGNSGGPVFDIHGNIVGILVGGYYGGEGLSVIIPAEDCVNFIGVR